MTMENRKRRTKMGRSWLLMLMSASLPLSAALAGVEPGKTYRIAVGTDEQHSLMVADASLEEKAAVVVWTDTDVPAQQWEAEDAGDGNFYFKNVYTGKYLDAGNIAAAQRSEPSAWTLEAVDEERGEYLLKQGKYLRVVSATDGRQPVVGSNAQTWRLTEVEAQRSFDASARQRMLDGFLRQYLQDRGDGYRTFVNGSWGEAETMEALLDCYEGTGDRTFLNIFEACYDYMRYHVGSTWDGGTTVGGYDWFGYDFNDDVMWLVIAAARAYHLTNKEVYLNDAKRNFDRIWNRAYLSYVGLLRWAEKSGDRNGANSCINGPAEVAACYIAAGTGDDSYYEKARELYSNQRRYLYVSGTGQVYDSVVFDPATATVKSRNTWASTYNQGTMLGAAVLLYRHFGDKQYRQDADKIIAYARQNLCNAVGLISVCQNADGDFQGFKGILMRYAGLYAREFRHEDYRQWVLKNAFHAYNNMNSRGFGHSAWLTKAREDLTFGDVDYGASSSAFGASTALTAACSVPLASFFSASPWQGEATPVEPTGSDEQTFSFQAPEAGLYKILVSYRAAAKRSVTIALNQGDALSATFPAAQSAASLFPFFAPLVKGENVIRLSCADGLPTIEKVQVMYLAALPSELEAEFGKTRGTTSIADDGDASGGRYVRDIGNGSGNELTLRADVAEEGDYDLDIVYFTGQNRQMYVRVNGGSRQHSAYASTGSWQASSAQVKTIGVTLKAGMNTLVFGNDNAQAPYIDKVMLKRQGESASIGTTTNAASAGTAWYTLSGMLTPHPTLSGIYVNGNKKYVINK